MANENDYSAVAPVLTAQALLALREMCVMPQLINGDYSEEPAQKGAQINVEVPSAITALEVEPANISPDIAGYTPQVVSILLDKWYSASFFMSDKDMMEVLAGSLPSVAREAVRALANQVNSSIFAQYKGIYGAAGESH